MHHLEVITGEVSRVCCVVGHGFPLALAEFSIGQVGRKVNQKVETIAPAHPALNLVVHNRADARVLTSHVRDVQRGGTGAVVGVS